MSRKATIDFETRSACSLKKCGTWVYSTHPSTEVLCLVFRLPQWVGGRTEVWHPAFPQLGLDECQPEALLELLTWIADGGLVEAHNVWFEFCIWKNQMVAKYGWPEIPLEQWRCSAAKAATFALPRGLDDAAKALKLPIQKDADGSKVMMKMTKPRKSRKKEREAWAKAGVRPPRYLWHESVELLDRLIAYCRQDVLAEEGISNSLLDLPESELAIFQMDLRMNLEGFQLDKPAVKCALRLIREESKILNRELSELTGRKVRRATQRARMVAWFADQGLALPDTQKATLDGLLDATGHSALSGCGPHVRRALEIVRALGRSSTAKFRAMKAQLGTDSRVRGGLLYYGATTGRWAGKGVQPHNFPKGSQKVEQEALWAALKTENRDVIARDYRSVMEALSNGLRGTIVPRSGCQLYVADYAAIEARVVLWLADAQGALDIFREGRDIYCEMASSIYEYPCTKDDHPTERALGKIAVLGLGYQMGAGKFQATCGNFGIDIDEEMAIKVVDAYRLRFWEVPELWKQQERAAMQAVRTGKHVHTPKATWFTDRRFLYCRLPSGRCLVYPYPLVQSKQMPWGESRDGLTFMGVDGYTHQWRRQHTYGGMLVENQTQAVARDIMAAAMLRAQQTDYRVILSVHDELIAEAPLGYGSVPEFEQVMATVPVWAKGCPIEAAGWRGPRYKKG